MVRATQTNPNAYPYRDAATLVVLLTVFCAAGCQRGAVVRPGDDMLAAAKARGEVCLLFHSPHPNSPKPVLRDIVFVVDASGSMTQTLPFVVNELNRVMDQLKTTDSMTVICFSGRGIYEVDSVVGWSGLRRCSPQFREEVSDWLDLLNHRFKRGGSGARFAEAAMVRALRYKPDLIIVCSDHLGGSGRGLAKYEIDQGELLATIHVQNNVQNPTKINTIQFVNIDPLVYAGLSGTLERIADETGGQHRYVSGSDLNLR